MFEPLMTTLIAVTVNLGGMLMIYSLMAFFLARFRWHGRGLLPVLVAIMVAGLFWIVPTMIGFGYFIVGTSASYSLCFGNWRLQEAYLDSAKSLCKLWGQSALNTDHMQFEQRSF